MDITCHLVLNNKYIKKMLRYSERKDDVKTIVDTWLLTLEL